MNQPLTSALGGDSNALLLELPPETDPAQHLSSATLALRQQLRESLGLPAHFLSGAGHQPVLWHAGILAKFITASRLASARRAASTQGASNWVHFLSDQDASDPFRMDVPLRDATGSIRRASIRLVVEGALLARDGVAAARPAQGARLVDFRDFASERAVDACTRVLAALGRSGGAAHAGIQLAQVMHECASRWLPAPCATLSSHALITCAGAILERIVREPVESAQAFNAALRADPRAAKPLHIAGESSEVPLWGVRSDGRRERIGALEARRRIDQGRLVLPRAFLASGLMRVICNTFVHGTGGARYERVGEAWWREFLGIELPPFATASATLVPELAALGLARETPVETSLAYRRAWWDPTQLDRPREPHRILEPVRAALLERIAEAPRKSALRRDAYRALSEHIAALRSTRRDELELLRASESHQQVARTQSALAHDRTWPFVLVPESAIDALAAAIADRLSARGH